MSALNISHLPPEVLTEVFRFLDVASLNQATLTCKLWKNLIESTCRWSVTLAYGAHGKFEADITLNAVDKLTFLTTTQRKFAQLEIDYITGAVANDHNIFDIFKRHGFNVKKLYINNCRFDNVGSLAALLECTTQLEQIFLFEVTLQQEGNIEGIEDEVLTGASLGKLKVLDFGASNEWVIKCFSKVNFKRIKIWDILPEAFSDISPLLDFVQTQAVLTSLTVDSSGALILVELGKLKVPIPFRLTRLELTMGLTSSSDDQESFLRFLQTQANSLTEMDMGHNIPSSVYDYVFANTTKLNTLMVCADLRGIPQNKDFYSALKENRNIRTVKVVFSAPDGSVPK